MSNHSHQIVQKLWNYCNVLPACAEPGAAGRRDDLSACDLSALQQAGAQAGGMSYLLARRAQASGDYVEQLTYLLFLKMADERTKPPYLPVSGLTASGLAQAGAGKPANIVPDKYIWPSLLKKDGDDLACACLYDARRQVRPAQAGGISSH